MKKMMIVMMVLVALVVMFGCDISMDPPEDTGDDTIDVESITVVADKLVAYDNESIGIEIKVKPNDADNTDVTVTAPSGVNVTEDSISFDDSVTDTVKNVTIEFETDDGGYTDSVTIEVYDYSYVSDGDVLDGTWEREFDEGGQTTTDIWTFNSDGTARFQRVNYWLGDVDMNFADWKVVENDNGSGENAEFEIWTKENIGDDFEFETHWDPDVVSDNTTKFGNSTLHEFIKQ